MVDFIDDHRSVYGVEPICAVLPIAPSTYFKHRARRLDPEKRPDRAKSDEKLRVEIQRVWDENHQVYGAEKVWRQLRREKIDVARCTVERLMRAMGLHGATRGRAYKTTTVTNEDSVRPADLVKREFSATRPNQLWVADLERHEALFNPAVLKGHRRRCVAARRKKLRAARTGRRRQGWTAALTTTGRTSTVRWPGPGKQDGKAYERNQRPKAPQSTHQLEPGGYGLGSSAYLHCHYGRRGTPWLVKVVGREAAVKDCGVTAAMLQGHSWTPTPSKGGE